MPMSKAKICFAAGQQRLHLAPYQHDASLSIHFHWKGCLHHCCPLGSSNQDLIAPCGPVHRLVLEGPLFGHYFEKVEVSNFEVASDAFATFKVGSMHSYWLLSGCSPQTHHACACACVCARAHA